MYRTFIPISADPGRRKGERARDYWCGSMRHAMVGGPVAAAETTAKPKWAVKTGPGATSGAAAKGLWKLVSQPSHWWKLGSGLRLRLAEGSGLVASVRKTMVFAGASDGAFGTPQMLRQRR